MLFCVSRRYKESASEYNNRIERQQSDRTDLVLKAVSDSRLPVVIADCRLEANYGYQREIEMVPLLLEHGYKADGCKHTSNLPLRVGL
jgi:hypothetical protein